MSKQKEMNGRTDKPFDKEELFQTKAPPCPGIPFPAKKQVECSIPSDLAVALTPKAFGQLFGYANATEAEVSLLGIVDRGGSVFTVREFLLVAQKGSSAHTELDQAAVGELVEHLIAEGRSGDAKKIRCWAHSHPGMDVFWSKTDDDNCHRMTADWLLSIVVSNGFKVCCRLDVASPIPFTIDNIPVFLESPVDAAIAAECQKEVKEKITPLPLFGPEKNKAKTGKGQNPAQQSFEMMDYCEQCGSWHPEDECPLQSESGYELARQDSSLAAEGDVWEDDVWF